MSRLVEILDYIVFGVSFTSITSRYRYGLSVYIHSGEGWRSGSSSRSRCLLRFVIHCLLSE